LSVFSLSFSYFLFWFFFSFLPHILLLYNPLNQYLSNWIFSLGQEP
jgi:hypothetical protein